MSDAKQHDDQELEAFLETLTVAGLKAFARHVVAKYDALREGYDKKLDDLGQRIKYLLEKAHLLDQKQHLLDQIDHPRTH